MSDSDTGRIGELPSGRRLLRSAVIAAAVAAALLITVVFPAEYGVDVTGVGRVLGLTRMGRIKETLSMNARASAAALSNYSYSGARTNLIEVRILPGQRRELGVVTKKGARLNFAWSAELGSVDYEIRGQPADSAGGSPQVYGSGSSRSDEGALAAALDGTTSWWWQNRTDKLVTVTIRINGDYDRLHEISQSSRQ